MGNYMYCESSPPVKRDIQPYNESVSKLLSLNVQFSKTCPHPYFINFHQVIPRSYMSRKSLNWTSRNATPSLPLLSCCKVPRIPSTTKNSSYIGKSKMT